ncbi:MAG: VWA domain-containing protein [Myxococcales bacterium]|nr:VWA domain-containing protein [Polyangiaceae bacterium]MDW8248538.1 VWA domain-containing protein [Myxococcales bacterium]
MATLVAGLLIFAAIRLKTGPIQRRVVYSLAEVQAVHAEVKLRGSSVQGIARVAGGDTIETGDEGRGRLRLDSGTNVILDRSTRLLLGSEGSIALERGRIFVQSVTGSPASLQVADATVLFSDAVVAVSVEEPGARVYCASGEATVRKWEEKRLLRGETAILGRSGVVVEPEKAFNDWTGGMAAPWSAGGKPHAAIGELWGRLSNVADEGGLPLATRQHLVEARIEGETAITRVKTTYFNAGNSLVSGDFRMALPPGALVSRFAIQQKGEVRDGKIHITNGAPLAPGQGPGEARLEWAGDGWVRGTLPSVEPGATVAVLVEYVEWLTPLEGRLSYRYPMATEGKRQVISEFRARIDASYANPVAIHAVQGATVEGAIVEVTRADFRPSSDLVVELDLPPHALGEARGYVARPSKEDTGGSYLLVRTEVPLAQASSGVTLALLLDVSQSIDPALLDAERALAEAILEGLGTADQVIVLAADQDARPVGPGTIGPVTPERRKAIREALAALRPGGATDLGIALERAADALPTDAPEGMVIYVGDGWPTVGDTSMEAIRARLARRAGGVPRLGAVAVGPLANRFALAGLVRGSGPVLEIADRSDAAETAVHLLAEALRPAVASVELDLGPSVDRVYPRGSRAVLAGSTAFAVGRVRGPLPRTVKLRYRKGAGVVEEVRNLHMPPVADEADVRRRWGAARVDELTLRGEGRESVIDVATKVGLLTPWTAFAFTSPGDQLRPTPLELRTLDLSSIHAPLSARIATPQASFGTLVGAPSEETHGDGSEEELRLAIIAAARRTLEEAMPGVRACRDSRAALRPELTGILRVSMAIDGTGKVQKSKVASVRASEDDPALNRCVEVILQGLAFFPSGLPRPVEVEHTLMLPPPRQLRGTTCSRASTLPLPIRRGVWREQLRRRGSSEAAIYLQARASCELPTWTDRRALLELILEAVPNGAARIQQARELDTAGETDAAALLRREAIRRVSTPEELAVIRRALLGDEPRVMGSFRKAYREATSDEARLSVVRKFLQLAPHDSLLRRRLFALLEALGRKAELMEEIARARQDPFADAVLLADGASALRRLDQQEEARRAFGELIERAPYDPFARAYVGDRLRGEGLFEDATAAYEVLSLQRPDDPAATLRLALGHAGAGRLDVASRVLDRVARTGGRLNDERTSHLAAVLAAVLTAEARDDAARTPDERSRLQRRLLEIPLPDAAALVLVQTHATDTPLLAKLARGEKAELESAADVMAPTLGLSMLRIERGDQSLRVRLQRPAELLPSRPAQARISVLIPGTDTATAKLLHKEVTLPQDGKPLDLRWDGSSLKGP